MTIYKQFESQFLNKIKGVSYIGKPKNFTMMYLTKKIEAKLSLLKNVRECLVFIEETIKVPDEISNKHIFIACNNPASAYTEIALLLEMELESKYKNKKYVLSNEGYITGEGVLLGEGTQIEPFVFIDHDVKIGCNTLIKTGAKIRRNTVIGDNCVIGENTVIGEPAFNLSQLDDGRVVPIPSFGGVIIGDNVFFGANDSVSKGASDNTILKDNVKIGSNVRIAHDVVLNSYVEIIGCSIVGGYCEIGEHTVTSMNCTLRNRIIIGKNCFIGMGSVVNHDVNDGTIITGNPAIPLEKAIAQKRKLEYLLCN